MNRAEEPDTSLDSERGNKGGGITWIASFPKSGNTWLRFICFHLVHGREPASSLELDGFINSRIRAENSCRYIKTHAAAFQHNELFAETSRAIYVHRHPLDVVCSAANYAALVGEAAADLADANEVAAWRRHWISEFITNGAPIGWPERFLTSTWSANVSSWVFEPLPFPVLVMGYDGMLKNPHDAVRKISLFLDIVPSEALIEGAVAATSFERLKAVEETEFETVRETGTGRGRFTHQRMPALELGYRFFNTGTSGKFRELLDRDTIAAAEKTFGQVAGRLGYSF